MVHVYDQGSFYSHKMLFVTDAEKEQKLQAGISMVASLCLAIGWTTEASFPHAMMNAFKNCLAVSLGTDYEFEAFNGKQLKEDILAGKMVGAAPAPAAGGGGGGEKKAEAAAPAPQEESEEEEADFGLFD